jgi:hypothetical protein
VFHLLTVTSFLLVALFCVTATLAIKSGPTAYLSTQDRESLKSTLLASQQKDGSWGSISSTSYAVQALRKLSVEVPNKKAVCDQLAAAPAADHESAYLIIAAQRALACGGFNERVSDEFNDYTYYCFLERLQ